MPDVSQQTTQLVFYVINKAPGDPATHCGDERVENVLLIFIQPPIDHLIIHIVSQGNGCSARQSSSKPPK